MNKVYPQIVGTSVATPNEDLLATQKKIELEIMRKRQMLSRMNRILLMCWIRHMKAKMQAAMQR